MYLQRMFYKDIIMHQILITFKFISDFIGLSIV